MAFYQLFHLILHEIDRFGCFMLKSGFFSKSLVLWLKKESWLLRIWITTMLGSTHVLPETFLGRLSPLVTCQLEVRGISYPSPLVMIIDACKLCEDWITLMVLILLVKLVIVTFIIFVLFCFIFFFLFGFSFCLSLFVLLPLLFSLSTCTNKLPLTFYLQIHDELKSTSPCRIVARSSKGLQRLFSICCYTHLICLL